MNVLTDPAFPVTMADGRLHELDLPSLFSALVADEIDEYNFLRPHQQAPWHSFLVQLASIALSHSRESKLPDLTADWLGLLRALTLDWPSDEPWRLVVADVHQPAFMQPGVQNSSADPHVHDKATPDDLDVLFTSKNHGVKQSLATEPSAADWIAALITLQTCGAYTKAGSKFGYFGSVRRNGEYATRPFVGLVPAGRVARHWRRDVTILIESKDWHEKHYPWMSIRNGQALLWCRRWDGIFQISPQDLHPWFIEICRRVRLYHGAKGRISARTVGSVRALVEAKHLRGHIGDPWIPVSKGEDPAAFNSSPTYQKVSAVLFADDWLRPILLEWHDGIDRLPMRVRFDVTVRGQGTTGGQHLREVPIDNDRRRAFLFDSAERDRLAKIAGQMMKDASTLNSPIIKTSLVTLIKGGASKVRLDDPASDWVEHWLKAADKRIEEEFFEYLFELAGTGDHQRWGSFLRRLAKQIFDAAARTVPISGVRRLKALAVAERRLWGGFRTYLPGHMPEGVEETADVE